MTTAVPTRATTWTPPCTAQPDLFHLTDGDRRHDWWWRAYAICHYCPIRRACVEGELERGHPVGGSVWGGWVFRDAGVVRPHPDDRDLYRRYYPTKETP